MTAVPHDPGPQGGRGTPAVPAAMAGAPASPASPSPVTPAPVTGALAGRTVLVTGAGRGLGRAMALGVAGAGATVVAVARTAGELAETAALADPGRVHVLPWDLAAPDTADDLVAGAQRLAGPLHGVVHAAGIQHRSPAADFPADAWQRILTVNLSAPFFLSTAVHRAQAARGESGSHVFIGSLASSIGLRDVAAYAASKAGVLGVVRALAVEWAASGARVNCVAPGYIRTALTEDLFADAERAAWVAGRIPMGRLGEPADLAGAIVFLLAEASAYITGQLINVDGGWLAG